MTEIEQQLQSLIVRLSAHIAQMAPHQREREAGKLLIEAHNLLLAMTGRNQ